MRSDYKIPCGCGQPVIFNAGLSDARGGVLTVRHRGGRLFGLYIPIDSKPLDLARDILRRLYYNLERWTALKEAGLHCAEYWKEPAEVMEKL
jgi:hypothetical protein